MLQYETDRTEIIVNRLVAICRLTRLLIIAVWLVGLGILGCSLAPAGEYPRLIGLIIGALLGYLIGSIISGIVIVGYEWMAQMLVAQENILGELRNRR